jgi:pyrimidine deaminase RibD-like protein
MIQGAIERFMWEAIYEGRKALPKCLPNPPVGCVLVEDEKIIARGYTNETGQYHAEAMALSQIKDKELKNVIAFVTLEPCSFQGRTPSCAKALVTRGIKEVYVGIIDPHPKNNGAGIMLLREAGIEVYMGVLSEIIQQDLQPYLVC